MLPTIIWTILYSVIGIINLGLGATGNGHPIFINGNGSGLHPTHLKIPTIISGSITIGLYLKKTIQRNICKKFFVKNLFPSQKKNSYITKLAKMFHFSCKYIHVYRYVFTLQFHEYCRSTKNSNSFEKSKDFGLILLKFLELN